MIVYVSSLTQGTSILFHKINCRFIISFCTIPVRGRKHPGAFCHPFFKKLHENCVICSPFSEFNCIESMSSDKLSFYYRIL